MLLLLRYDLSIPKDYRLKIGGFGNLDDVRPYDVGFGYSWCWDVVSTAAWQHF